LQAGKMYDLKTFNRPKPTSQS